VIRYIYGTCSPRTKNYVISCSKSDLGWLGSHVKLSISHDLVKFLQGLPSMSGMGPLTLRKVEAPRPERRENGSESVSSGIS
jgi:hypothetical protein